MQNKRRIPQLAGSIMTREKVLVEGRSIEASRITLNERSGLVRKLVLRRPKGYFPSDSEAIGYQHRWAEFHKAGLPVPWYSKVDFRRKSKTYLGIFQPDLEKRYGKLIPINDGSRGAEYRGHPTFLKRLRLSRDRKVIGELAQDLAKLHELKYIAHWVDQWQFYKKGNTYGRLLLDLEELYKLTKKSDLESQTHGIVQMFSEFEKFFGEKEFLHFVRQYVRACKYKPRAELVADYYLPKPPDYYSYRGYRRREKEEKLHPKQERPLFV